MVEGEMVPKYRQLNKAHENAWLHRV